MLDSDELSRAVSLHERCYRLLRWLSTAISRGIVVVGHAHDVGELPDVAAVWIQKHTHSFPSECRPESAEPLPLREFANMFTSYLFTSFDLVDSPGMRRISTCGGCPCPLCSHLVAASHLQPKKLSSTDKKRAEKLKEQYLRQLAVDIGRTALDPTILAIKADFSFREPLAQATYGSQLINRMKGQVEGPAVLALWRQFAWLETGSPKKNFKFSPKQVLEAERSLVTRLQKS